MKEVSPSRHGHFGRDRDKSRRQVDRLRAENRRLRREIQALREQLEAAETRLDATEKRCRALEKQVAHLRSELSQAQRQGKRQAAPFSKGAPKENPQKPGRKPGRNYGRKGHRSPPPAEVIEEHYDVPLPDHCPHCDGRHLEETKVEPQYQTEIVRRCIHRQFDIHFGVCRDCGGHVQGRHELQTSDAIGAAGAQLGPQAHAAIAILNKELGLSHGKVQRCLKQLFGLSITRGASAHSVRRTARCCEDNYREIQVAIRGSPYVVPDETGWRVGGHNAWLHVAVGDRATCYAIAAGRGAEVLRGWLGADWSGILIHDGWSPYDTFDHARHQQCLAHLKRRCERVLQTAPGPAAQFPRCVLMLIDSAFARRRDYREGKLNADQLAEHALGLVAALEQLLEARFTCEENQRLAMHLKKHLWHWFWFLLEPEIDATNWQAEHAVRMGVVNRKVWGGNREWPGAWDQGVLMSVLRTCQQTDQDGLAFLTQARCSTKHIPLITNQR